jgi:hypothetical protein
MLEMARAGKLQMCERVIKQSRPIATIPPEERIIKDQVQLLDIALSCVYQCPDIDQLTVMNDIFEVLTAPIFLTVPVITTKKS